MRWFWSNDWSNDVVKVEYRTAILDLQSHVIAQQSLFACPFGYSLRGSSFARVFCGLDRVTRIYLMAVLANSSNNSRARHFHSKRGHILVLKLANTWRLENISCNRN